VTSPTAIVLLAVALLWPLAAFAGGLALAPLAGLCALVASPAALREFAFRPYMAVILLFLQFAAVSAIWSPHAVGFAEADLSRLTFSVSNDVVRVGLLLLALGALLAAVRTLSAGSAARAADAITLALAAQLAIVLLLTAFETEALALFAGFMADSGEGVQNLSRNSLILAVAAPVLVLGTVRRMRSRRLVWAVSLAIICAIAAPQFLRGVDAGVLALALGAGFACIAAIFPVRGYRVLAGFLAAIIVLAPVLFGLLTRGAALTPPETSAQWRLAIWDRVIQEIERQPLRGGGIGILRTIDERIAAGPFAGEVLVPNHAHNMFLQLWAETGLSGALLLALAVLLSGWRLPPPRRLGRSGIALAAVAGGMTACALVSFDLWREWWWAAGGLLCVFIMAAHAAGDSPPPLMSHRHAEAVKASAPAVGSGPFAAIIHGPPRVQGVGDNFHLLRLALALMVVAYHAVALSDVADWRPHEGLLAVLAEAGVQGFFVVSGYLVLGSLERSSSLAAYFGKRARRLLPGYATVIGVCTVGALLLSEAARAQLSAVLSYLGWNLIFLNFMAPDLPGLFEGNRFSAVNGALWTIKIEVMFYLLLPTIAWLLRKSGRRRWAMLAAIYCGAEIWRHGFAWWAVSGGPEIAVELSRQLPGQLSFFITGAALYLWRDRLDWRVLGPVALAALALSYGGSAGSVLRAFGLGVGLIWIATAWPRLFNPARFGDLSYGIYILHFPLLQALIAAGLFRTEPAVGLAVFAGLLGVSALMLWTFIEKPALLPDSRYRHP
jgi:peptidoglycan/LPS O-acetylase OafA/YrhL